MSFVRDLKERRIVQILATYLATGWVGVEVIDSLVDNAILPGLAYTLALIWYITGIPIALLIGWYHGEKDNQKAPKWEVGVILIVILSLSGFSATRISDYMAEQLAVESAAEGRLNPNRIAVTYFDVSGTAGDSSTSRLRSVADALTEELIKRLDGVRVLDVISPNGVRPFRATNTPADSIAERLQAGTVVAGSVHRDGEDGVRVDVRIIDGASGAEYRRASLRHSGEQLLEAPAELAKEVGRFLRSRLGEEIAVRTSERATESVDAWALLHQARRVRKDADAALYATLGGAAGRAALLEEADSLLSVAHRLDSDWSAPLRERAELAYVRSRLAHDGHERIEWAERAVALANQALEHGSGGAAEALAIRGTARYWRWLNSPHMQAEQRAILFKNAREDLEKAVNRDPGQAEAYSTLSHLYYNDHEHGGPSAVALAAQRAYDEDAYLEAADDILWRLYLSTVDIQDFRRAKAACEEGTRRFPENYRFTHCHLRLMATPAMSADPDSAWALAARTDSLSPEARRAYTHLENRIFVAGVLARAGLADSARAELTRVHRARDEHIDPAGDLLSAEAAIRAQMGDTKEAVRLLEQYLALHPGHAFSPATGLAWWWEPLKDDPAFQRLVRLRPSHADH